MANYNHIVFFVFLMCLVVGAPQAKGAISCGTVTSSLAPCLSYIQGGFAGAVPDGCCNGIRSLNSAAQTTPDRQAACECLKSAAQAFPNINFGAAQGVPPKCGVNLPYKLDPATDCATIQ